VIEQLKNYKNIYKKEDVNMSEKEQALRKIDEISRIVLALHISLLNRKYKYIEKDFESIGRCLYELKDILNNL
jgi:hypothetical protein